MKKRLMAYGLWLMAGIAFASCDGNPATVRDRDIDRAQKERQETDKNYGAGYLGGSMPGN